MTRETMHESFSTSANSQPTMHSPTLSSFVRSHSERAPNRQLDSRLSDGRHAEVLRLLAAFRSANAAGTAPQHDAYVTRLMQRMQDGTLRVVDHVLVMARNWFDRNAPRAEVEAPFRACLAIIASWYPAPPTCLRELSRLETIAQGPADVVQIDIHTLEGPALVDAERKLAADYEATGNLLDAVRVKLYSVPPAA